MPKMVIIFILIALGIIFALWDLKGAPNGILKPKRSPAPDVVFTDLNGVNHSLSDFRGKTVFVNFWATWCPPCVKEMPQLIELAAREGNDFVLIGLSVDENTQIVKNFIQRISKGTLPDNVIFGMDAEKTISKDAFGTTMYPETYIIDMDGMIVKKYSGIADWLGTDVNTVIESSKENTP